MGPKMEENALQDHKTDWENAERKKIEDNHYCAEEQKVAEKAMEERHLNMNRKLMKTRDIPDKTEQHIVHSNRGTEDWGKACRGYEENEATQAENSLNKDTIEDINDTESTNKEMISSSWPNSTEESAALNDTHIPVQLVGECGERDMKAPAYIPDRHIQNSLLENGDHCQENKKEETIGNIGHNEKNHLVSLDTITVNENNDIPEKVIAPDSSKTPECNGQPSVHDPKSLSHTKTTPPSNSPKKDDLGSHNLYPYNIGIGTKLISLKADDILNYVPLSQQKNDRSLTPPSVVSLNERSDREMAELNKARLVLRRNTYVVSEMSDTERDPNEDGQMKTLLKGKQNKRPILTISKEKTNKSLQGEGKTFQDAVQEIENASQSVKIHYARREITTRNKAMEGPNPEQVVVPYAKNMGIEKVGGNEGIKTNSIDLDATKTLADNETNGVSPLKRPFSSTEQINRRYEEFAFLRSLSPTTKRCLANRYFSENYPENELYSTEKDIDLGSIPDITGNENKANGDRVDENDLPANEERESHSVRIWRLFVAEMIQVRPALTRRCSEPSVVPPFVVKQNRRSSLPAIRIRSQAQALKPKKSVKIQKKTKAASKENI